MYRGHMYLWQDHGIFGVFDPDSGWCRPDADGAEPGGVKGVVCDVIPDGKDMVGWFGVGLIVVLLTGFYLWYWPGVKRWANALRDPAGPRSVHVQHVAAQGRSAFVVWVPLTGRRLHRDRRSRSRTWRTWYENVTPGAARLRPVDAARGGLRVRAGRTAASRSGSTGARTILEERYPDRAINYLDAARRRDRASYAAWVDPRLRPVDPRGRRRQHLRVVDQYTGETLYDGTPEDGNVFDQAWDDWSFPLHTGDFGGTARGALGRGRARCRLVLGGRGSR